MAEAQTQEKPMSEKMVLIADDDIEIRRIVKHSLSKLECKVIEAKDGEETLEQILVHHPDVVVLDVMMPQLSGWEICRYIREKPQFNDVSILMLTAIGPTVNEMTSPLYGADDYMDKPFMIEDLVERVREFLQFGRPSEENSSDE